MRAKQWRHGILIGILLMVAAWFAVSIWGLVEKASVAVSEAHQAQARYKALEERKAALVASLATLNTVRGKDEAIRTAFGVARPGEEVIVVVPPPVATSTPLVPWWQKVLQWFQ